MVMAFVFCNHMPERGDPDQQVQREQKGVKFHGFSFFKTCSVTSF